MLVATAGHIDHGKTTLVKALTGVDTDRLPQEKARGISIDLGFAYWNEPEAGVIGFVDVPGHERFVRNMLAGVCAIDFALLIVAADDGVMPQTREHLHIIDLLDIRRGVVAITKADRVDSERLRQVGAEVRALLAGTVLRDAPLLPVSAVSGAGVPQLRTVLVRAAAGFRREAADGRCLRYAIDRAFTVAGSGTVVTGTVFDGVVSTGDRLLLSPAGIEVRVRGLQKDGAKAARAQAGERCALNLAGLELAQVRRGDWVLDQRLHAPTTRLDVELRLLASEARPLKHWTPVHLHLGTRDVTARVSLRRGDSIAPDGKGFARLIVDQPIVALHGDRFIVRDQSALRTLGGGIVLDAFPAQRRQRYELHQRRLRAFAAGAFAAGTSAADTSAADTPAADTPAADTPAAGTSAAGTPVADKSSADAFAADAAALQALVACTPDGVDAAQFARNFNLDDASFDEVLRQSDLVIVDVTGKKLADGVGHKLVASGAGQKSALGAGQKSALGGAAHKRVVTRAKAEAMQPRRPPPPAGASPEQARVWALAGPVLRAAGRAGLTVAQLAQATHTKPALLLDVLHRHAKAGEAVRVGDDRFYLRATFDELITVARGVAHAAPRGRFTLAAFRDAAGIGRALAAQVLEAMDRLGVTLRVADARVLRPAPANHPVSNQAQGTS